jgi:hypothetical protein
VRRFTRRWIAPSGGRGSEGGGLWAARPTWIRKLKGKVAWRGSVEHREDAEGVAAQGPRDMAKAKLLKAQSPAVQAFTLCDTASEVAATGIRRLRIFVVPTLPAGGRQAASLLKGTDRAAYVTLERPAQGEYGIAYGTRVLWRRSVNSSRRGNGLPGRTGKPSTWAKWHRCQSDQQEW